MAGRHGRCHLRSRPVSLLARRTARYLQDAGGHKYSVQPNSDSHPDPHSDSSPSAQPAAHIKPYAHIYSRHADRGKADCHSHQDGGPHTGARA